MPMIQYNSDGHSFSAPVEANPLEGNLKMTGYTIPLANEDRGIGGVAACAFDGRYLWQTVNSNEFVVLRTDTLDGETVKFPMKNGVNGNSNLAQGYSAKPIVFDGTYIWLLPWGQDTLVRIDPQSGTMTGYSTIYTLSLGGVFDGTYIWIISENGDLYRLDPKEGALSGVSKFGLSPCGITYDGQNIWVICRDSSKYKLIKFSIQDMRTQEYILPITPEYQNISSCLCDGKSIWIIPAPTSVAPTYPQYNEVFLKFDPNSEQFIQYSTDDGANGNVDMDIGPCFCRCGTFDGKYLWLYASNSHQLVRVDTQTGTMKGFSYSGTNLGNWKKILSNQVQSVTYDGNNLWFSPYSANRLLKVSLADIVDPNLNTYIITHKYCTESGVAIQSDTRHFAKPDDSYTATTLTIPGYTCIGYKLDGGTLQTGTTVTINDVQADHTITFVYKENGGTDPGTDPKPGDGDCKCNGCAKVKIEIISCNDNDLLQDICGLIKDSNCSCK